MLVREIGDRMKIIFMFVLYMWKVFFFGIDFFLFKRCLYKLICWVNGYYFYIIVLTEVIKNIDDLKELSIVVFIWYVYGFVLFCWIRVSR